MVDWNKEVDRINDQIKHLRDDYSKKLLSRARRNLPFDDIEKKYFEELGKLEGQKKKAEEQLRIEASISAGMKPGGWLGLKGREEAPKPALPPTPTPAPQPSPPVQERKWKEILKSLGSKLKETGGTVKYWWVLNIIFGLLAIAFIPWYLLPKIPYSFILIGYIIFFLFIVLWLVSLKRRSWLMALGLLIFACILIVVIDLLVLIGFFKWVNPYIAPLAQPFQMGYCGLISIPQAFGYMSLLAEGKNPMTVAYEKCMKIGAGEEQKAEWYCGDNCLDIKTEGTAVENRQFFLTLTLMANAGAEYIKNVKIRVLDEGGNEMNIRENICTPMNPCSLSKAIPTEEITADFGKISCHKKDIVQVKVQGSYDYTATTPIFWITVYPSAKSPRTAKEPTETEKKSGPLKFVFAGTHTFFSDRPIDITLNARLYYMAYGGKFTEAYAKGSKMTITQFADQPLTPLGCGEPTWSAAGGSVEVENPFKVDDRFIGNFYPFASCDFKLPQVTENYKQYGFQGRTDYIFTFEKLINVACIWE